MSDPEYINCNLCGANQTELIEAAEEPFGVVKCKSCGLIYVNPQPNTSDILSCYGADYYSEWITNQEQKRQRLWQSRLKQLSRYKQRGRLLDVGCADGAFLAVAREQGWDAYGTEISEYACRFARERRNLNIFRGQLQQANFADIFFDCISIWHTLEHLQAPLAALKQIHRLLKHDGLLIVETPNANDFVYKIVYRLLKGRPERLFSLQAKELHLFHFSPSTLRAILEKAGFQLVGASLNISQLCWLEKLLESLAIFIFYLTRINVGSSIRIYARKVDE